jgi:hypothetical protein
MTIEKQSTLLPEIKTALADIPVIPPEIYPAISKKIKRQQIVTRSVWALAACLCLAFSAQFFSGINRQPVAFAAETIDELASVNTYYNSEEDKGIIDSDLENILY